MAGGRRAVASFVVRVLAFLAVLVVLRRIGIIPSLRGGSSRPYSPDERIKVGNARVNTVGDDNVGGACRWKHDFFCSTHRTHALVLVAQAL